MKLKKKCSVKEILSLTTATIALLTSILGLIQIDNVKTDIDQIKIVQRDYVVNQVNNYFTDEKSVADELRNAQNAYVAGDYPYAFEIYKKYKNTNALAALNLGYMYSNGLGVDVSFDSAAQCYLIAYEHELQLGLDNYISLHFLKPHSIKGSLSALLLGIKENQSFAIKYAAYLETGKLYTEASTAKNTALKFKDRNDGEQLLLLKNKLNAKTSDIEYIEEGNQPVSTDFITYEKQDGTHTKRYVERTITEIELCNNEWVKTEVPVYDFKTYNIYKRNYLSYQYSDFVFEEKLLINK